MLLLCDHSIYLTHALHISCLLDAARNFSNDFPQVRTVYYTIVAFYPSLIIYEGKSVNKSQKAMKKILSEIFT
jgi:hypothetical protein